MIKRLRLQNFRQFRDLSIEFDKPITIIHGNNTKGKTTILESIYMLFNLKSPWSTERKDIINHEEDFTKITATLSNEDLLNQEIQLELIQTPTGKNLKLDGLKVPPHKFKSVHTCTIFTPEQIELLLYLPEKRREFMNAVINKYDPEYLEYYSQYMRVLRHRNAYLKKLKSQLIQTGHIPPQSKQLEIWTQELIQKMIPIIRGRIELIESIKDQNTDIEYKFGGLSTEFIEKAISNPDVIKKTLEEEFRNGIRRDIVRGYTNIGIHRDSWELKRHSRNIKKFASRGEKRTEIAKLILKTQDLLKIKLGYYPILLLDDISAELDVEHTEEILTLDTVSKQQTIITTVHLDMIPRNIRDIAQIIHLD